MTKDQRDIDKGMAAIARAIREGLEENPHVSMSDEDIAKLKELERKGAE